ncbi:hypothetical protein PQY68_05230, partial [Planktomarina temperata]|nr:hypothetical protein [Planktomarina temperata]
METEFTPLLSLLGGGLIGASAVLLMATHGRIAGISGILSRMLPPHRQRSVTPTGSDLFDRSVARRTHLDRDQ